MNLPINYFGRIAVQAARLALGLAEGALQKHLPAPLRYHLHQGGRGSSIKETELRIPGAVHRFKAYSIDVGAFLASLVSGLLPVRGIVDYDPPGPRGRRDVPHRGVRPCGRPKGVPVIGSGGEGGLDRLRFTVPADLGAVDGANASLEEFLQGIGVDGDLIYAAVLALEEILTNICKYAFPAGNGGKHEIAVEADFPSGSLRLRIADDGREFDPLAAPPPPLEKPVEDRPVGGLGIHLLRNLADHLEYRRTEGQNVLTLLFSLDPKNRRFSCR